MEGYKIMAEAQKEKKKAPKAAAKTAPKKTAKKTTATKKAKTKPKKTSVKEKVTPDMRKTQSVKADNPDVITLPPFLVLIAIVAGLVLNFLIPLSFGSSFIGWIGFFLFFGALRVFYLCKKEFNEKETNISPYDPTIALTKDGPYKYSRNPIYVSFIVSVIALGFMVNSIMLTLMAVPLFYALALGVIIPEEKYLTEKFGEEYSSYKKAVRRWF